MVFLQKLENLHPAIQFFFDNEISGEFVNILVQENKDIKKEEIEHLVREFVINDFNFGKIKALILTDLKNNKERADAFAADFLGIIFYPLADFLPEANIAKQLLDMDVDLQDYQQYKDKLELQILQEENDVMDDLIESREKGFNIEEEYS